MHGKTPDYIKLATNKGWYFHTAKNTELLPVKHRVVLTPILGGMGKLAVLEPSGKFHILNPMVKN